MAGRLARLIASGASALWLTGCAAPGSDIHDPPGTPEDLARSCIVSGCWAPSVNGVTSVYACAGGLTIRTRFDGPANKLSLTRGDQPPVLLSWGHRSYDDFLFEGMGLSWAVHPGHAQLTTGEGPPLACDLKAMEQAPGEGVRIIGGSRPRR